MRREWLRKVVTAGLALLAPTWAYAADPDEVRMATEKLAEILGAELKDSVERRLASSGLAPEEAQRIASETVLGYAKCVVNALVTNDDPRSQKLLLLVARASNRQEIRDAMHRANPTDDPALEDSLGPVVGTCRLAVDQEAGLPANNDAT
jgi:hypothetical protein